LRLVAHTAGSIRQLLPEGLVGSAVRVSSAAHVIADAVAEFTLLQILCSLRGLHVLDRDVRVGAWPGAADRNRGQLLAARTIGIIGGGRTGRAIVNLLHPFGSRILLCDPTWTGDAARRNSVELVDLDTLLTSCDVISLHAPLLPSTELMIGSSELAVMRDGALLVNSARAGLIDAPALLAELQQGRIRAALDVFPDEPLPADSEWCQWPGLLLSPHAAGHTVDSHLRQGAASVNEVLNFLRGDPLLYEVCADQTAMLA
jgi:phosphoglycerate dehydrogenase-like enzyme